MTPQEQVFEDLTALVPPLLQALDRLAFVSRYLHPPTFLDLLDALEMPEAPLAELRPRLDAWPPEMAGFGAILATAADEALAAYAELRAAPDDPDGLTAIFRALRHLPRALETLYPLAANLPPISRFFLTAHARDDVGRWATRRDDTGVFHVGTEPGARGEYSIYVPETYDGETPLPLVFALHGGSGNGRAFLWSWVREARSLGAIIVAPTAIGRTWALQGPDPDTPNLTRILNEVRGRWRIDDRRLLMSGMSDGGTFSYVSGLEPGSPFTHLAPTSAAFHPMMAQFADQARITGLPIHITHGGLDWMFDVGMARGAKAALEAAGARVTYRELDDLSHTYPRELNGEVLAWLAAL